MKSVLFCYARNKSNQLNLVCLCPEAYIRVFQVLFERLNFVRKSNWLYDYQTIDFEFHCYPIHFIMINKIQTNWIHAWSKIILTTSNNIEMVINNRVLESHPYYVYKFHCNSWEIQYRPFKALFFPALKGTLHILWAQVCFVNRYISFNGHNWTLVMLEAIFLSGNQEIVTIETDFVVEIIM